MTTLSAVEFEVTWGHLGLGDLPAVLDLPSVGRTREERQEIVARVIADLRGELPTLAHQLVTLARYAWAVDTRIITDTMTRARGAVAARRGVLAVLTGARVTIRSVPEHAVVQEVAALAGTVANGRADSVSIRADALDTAAAVAGDDLRALSDGLVTLGERAVDARAVARICARAQARGQFSVRRAGRDGRPHAARRVVGFHDTPTGRFLQLRRDGWVTFTPDTGTQLVTQVNQLLDELDPERTRR